LLYPLVGLPNTFELLLQQNTLPPLLELLLVQAGVRDSSSATGEAATRATRAKTEMIENCMLSELDQREEGWWCSAGVCECGLRVLGDIDC